MVARTGTPVPKLPSARNSTGKPVGVHGSPVCAARAVTRSPAGPAWASPLRSPLTSATTTGTPAAESCSAISCSVLVLPVPVAPAMSPCRLTIASASRTCASGCGVPAGTTAPRSRAGPLTAYPAAIRVAASSAGTAAGAGSACVTAGTLGQTATSGSVHVAAGEEHDADRGHDGGNGDHVDAGLQVGEQVLADSDLPVGADRGRVEDRDRQATLLHQSAGVAGDQPRLPGRSDDPDRRLDDREVDEADAQRGAGVAHHVGQSEPEDADQCGEQHAPALGGQQISPEPAGHG